MSYATFAEPIVNAPVSEPSASILYRLLSDTYHAMPYPIQIMHRQASLVASGRCRIDRGTNWMTQLIATIASMPKAGDDVSVRLEIEPEDEHTEVWTRYFADVPMVTVQRLQDGQLTEYLGPGALSLSVQARKEGLFIQSEGLRVFGFLPIPKTLSPKAIVQETVLGNDILFDVDISLPFLGRLIHYSGYLSIPGVSNNPVPIN